MENNIIENQKSQSDAKPQKVRYALLDELRGFMVLCMVFYHGFFTLNMLFEWNISRFLWDFFTPVEPLFACGFIMLSGLMCGFSRSNLRRGALCFCVAIGLSAVTIIGSGLGFGRIEIYFGILHLLGVSMLFCGVFDFVLKRLNKWVGLVSSLALFLLTYGIPETNFDFLGVRQFIPMDWYMNPGLFPLGITTSDFFSADYFPIIPWIFIFLAGYFLYKFHLIEKFSKVFEPKRIKPLGFLGRHALIIYILHQPIIYLLCLPFML